jgi:hypothetical protein
MSGTTSTTLTNLINEIMLPEVQSTVYKNVQLFNLWTPEPHTEGAHIEWPINVGPATDYASTYSEGDPYPNPNVATPLKGSIAKQPFHALVKVSNVALDYMRGNKVGWSNTLTEVTKLVTEDLINYVNTTLLASFEAGVEATGSYDGNDRATYTSLASYEENNSTTLALSHLEDMLEALMDNNRGVPHMNIGSLCPFNQLTNYQRLSTGASNLPFNSSAGSPVDGGRMIPGATFSGTPIYPIGGMTDTVWYMGDMSTVKIYEARPITLTPVEVYEDATAIAITCNYQIVIKNTQKWGKLTAKTA